MGELGSPEGAARAAQGAEEGFNKMAYTKKTPESEAAKEVGNIPKQTIDKATNDLNANLQKGADRDKKEDQK